MLSRTSACRRGLLGRLVALLTLLLALSASRPAVAAFDYADESWEGSSELLELARTQLGKSRVEIVATIDWSELGPADAILVLHPVVSIDFDEASAFMRSGGRIAVLDDFGKGAELLERFQIRRISAPHHPGTSLRENSAFAIAVPAVQQVAGRETGRHPVVADVQSLVTNHPSGLTHNNLTPVLEIQAVGEPDVTLAVTGIIGDKGRLFAMGDPSAVMNLMLRYPGNRAFAGGLINYLVEDDSWGARGGKLYLVANRFKQTGSYGGDATLSDDLGDYVDGMQDMLDDAHSDGLPDEAALILAGMLGLVALGLMAMLATRSYRRISPRYARRVPLVAQAGLAGRAAVLGAPTTHRALALVELKAALLEALAHRLDLPMNSAATRLVSEIDRQQALSQRSSRELEIMLAELNRAESAVLGSQAIRISAEAVVSMRDRLLAILDEVDERLGSSPGSRRW